MMRAARRISLLVAFQRAHFATTHADGHLTASRPPGHFPAIRALGLCGLLVSPSQPWNRTMTGGYCALNAPVTT